VGVTKLICDELPTDPAGYGFNTIGELLSTSALHVEVYERLVTQALDEVLGAAANDKRRVALVPCTPKADPADACAQQIVRGLAEKAWRRPLVDSELTPHLDL